MTLSLSPVVDINVVISPMAAPRRAFNQACIIGASTVIPLTERVRQYSALEDMLDDGFQITDPEYLAATLYFGQSPRPDFVWIGRKDTTVGAIREFEIADGGADYGPGDVVTVVQAGGALGTLTVLSVDGDGAVLTAALTTAGSGYAAAAGLATTVDPAGGAGCLINITDVTPETSLEAFQACRAKDNEWYVGIVCGATKADHIAIAGYAEAATPTTVYAYTTQDAEVPLGTAGNVFEVLKGLLYRRSIGQYSTDTPYAIAAIIGYAMAQNTGLANSAYTLKFKREVGVHVEALSTTQVGTIEGNNGNLYVNRGYYYDMFEQGVMASAQFFDEIINLDMLANNIQLNVMDLLYGNPKVPQTDPGVTQIMRAVTQACDDSVNIGFLAPGVWNGQRVLNLNTGDTMPKGYVVQAEKVADQSDADRALRKSPPVYACVKEAGAVHSVVIGVYVDR